MLMNVFRVKQDAVSLQKLSDLKDVWKNYDCIGIDEGQFYDDVSKKVQLLHADCGLR